MKNIPLRLDYSFGWNNQIAQLYIMVLQFIIMGKHCKHLHFPFDILHSNASKESGLQFPNYEIKCHFLVSSFHKKCKNFHLLINQIV